MIDHSEKAMRALPAFYENFNDVDIFVEDASRETRKLFAILLTRALRGKVRIDRVFPIGSKSLVLKTCRDDQAVGGRRRVYIVDGDMELCLGEPSEPLMRLFRLPRYCLENYLIDAVAASLVASRESVDLDEEAVFERMEFDAWISYNAKPLRRLFTAFAVVKRLAPEIPTVANGCGRVTESALGNVSALKIEHYIGRIRDAVDAANQRGSFVTEYRKISRDHRHKSDKDFMLHFVSGKDFLLPLMKLRINSVVRLNKSTSILKLNLAEHVPVNELGDLLDFAA